MLIGHSFIFLVKYPDLLTFIIGLSLFQLSSLWGPVACASLSKLQDGDLTCDISILGPKMPLLFFSLSNFFIFIFLLHFMTCEMLVPQPEIECGCLAVRACCPNHWTTRELSVSSFSCGKDQSDDTQVLYISERIFMHLMR